ncbi:reverse transcriptase [Trichonephila clavipes]|nr:reverse transcriptase [Trichonephila clavipes]
MPILKSKNPALWKRSKKDSRRMTCQKQTESARNGSVSCLRTHWPWKKTPPTTLRWRGLGYICEATMQVFPAGLPLVKVVFIDSHAAILALSRNTPTDCLNTIQCRTKIVELISYGWTVALQYVSSHVGIPGNERADQKAKQGTESTQQEVPLTLRRANNIIPTFIDKYTAGQMIRTDHKLLCSITLSET